MKCCICGEEIQGYGNNPYGAVDSDGNIIKVKPEDRCCDACNANYVILGRLIRYKASQALDMVDTDDAEIAISQLRSLVTEGELSAELYDFILKNYDEILGS